MYANLTSDYSFTYDFELDLDTTYTAIGNAIVDYDICAADRSVGEPGGPCDFRITEIRAEILNVEEDTSVLVILNPGQNLFKQIADQILDRASYAAIDDYDANR